MLDLIIYGGTVVLADGCYALDLGIERGRIALLGAPGSLPGAPRTIAAEGCYLLPGGVDPHVHVHWPFLNDTTADDFATASIAAATGGDTTLIDFAQPRMGPTPLERIANRRAEADGCTVVDYGLHCVLTDGSPQTLTQMEELVNSGVTSFKMYMTYSRRGLKVEDATLVSVMRQAAKLNALVLVHAENGSVAEANEARFAAEGRLRAADFPRHKPNYVEAEAVGRAIFWAGETGARLHILHLSTAEGLELIRKAQQRGVRVSAETCPQYLLLDDKVYDRPDDGHRFICSPPIRSKADADALWKGIAEQVITIVGTDHCAFTTTQKDRGRDNFTDVPNGLPGIETRLALLYSEGVAKGRISLNDLAAVTSRNPARSFGIFPRKGSLVPGSDADLVLIDPEARWTLAAKDLHMAVDWSPYEGWQMQGGPVMTIARGEVIVDHGRYVGKAGGGAFLKRGT